MQKNGDDASEVISWMIILEPVESLCVNNSNLLHILHRFGDMVDYLSNFAVDRRCQPFTHWLRVKWTPTFVAKFTTKYKEITNICLKYSYTLPFLSVPSPIRSPPTSTYLPKAS